MKRILNSSNHRFLPTLEGLEERIALSPGAMDPSFSSDGKQTIEIGGTGGSLNLDTASSVAVQPDGKIVLAGTAFVQNGPETAKTFGVVRLNANGTPDNSFHGDGQNNVFVGGDAVARGMALQPDGKIIVVGSATSLGNYEFAVLRMNADGTPDMSFGDSGKRLIGFDIGGVAKVDDASGVVVQPDGKIVVVGSAQIASSNSDFAAVRLLPTGAPDPGFGPGGKRTIPFDLGGNKSDLATSVALQADGRVVLAGKADGPNGDSDFAAARLNTDGTLDASFGTGGKRTVAFDVFNSTKQDAAADVEIQANGAIVLAGRAAFNATSPVLTALARLKPDGTLDKAFPLVPGEGAAGLALQPDGKIVVVSTIQISSTQGRDMYVQRFTPQGDFDPTFNFTGAAMISLDTGGSNDDISLAVALQPDGKIVIAGSAATGATSSVFAVARLEGANVHFLATGGAPNRVEVFSRNGAPRGSFTPFEVYDGGVAVALGDINGDGTDDLVASATIGNPAVKIYDGTALNDSSFYADPDSHLITTGFPYGINFNVGTNIAVGDVNADGFADLITGAVPGNPHVKVFSGAELLGGTIPTGNAPSLLAQGFVYGLGFNVGANVAAGDVNGDGFADIITGASAGNPHTRVFDAKTILVSKLIPTNAGTLDEFFPYGINFNVGSFVAVADYNGDGFGDVVTGASVGNPEVRVFSGKDISNGTFDLTTSLLDFFFAFEQGQNIGVSVAATDFNGDGKADVLTGTRNGPPRLRAFKNNLPSSAIIITEVDFPLAGFSGPLYVAA